MSAVSKNRVKRLISQIGNIEDVHGEGSVASFESLVISEDGSNIVATDGSGGATTFFLDLAQSGLTGVTFDGIDGACTIPTAGIQPAAGTWWLEFTMLEDHDSKRFFSYYGSDRISFFYFGATTDIIAGSVGTTDHNSTLYTGAIAKNIKYQCAITFGANVASIYLDGALTDSDPNIGAINWWTGWAVNYWMGRWNKYVAAYTNIQYSNVAVFDYALPASELLELKAGTKTPTTTTTPALSWWPCTDTTGSTLTDTISARNGTCSGGFTFDAAAQAFTLANPSGLTAGQTYRWLVKTGGLRTCTYGSKFVSEGVASLEISQGADKKDMIVGTVSDDGSQIYCNIRKDLS
jgi:hypothetical protein